MTENASLALKSAQLKIDALAEDDKAKTIEEGQKVAMLGSIVLDVVAAFLHQSEANAILLQSAMCASHTRP